MKYELNEPVRYLGDGPDSLRVGRVSKIEHDMRGELFTKYTITFHDDSSVDAHICNVCNVMLAYPHLQRHQP